jgi:hypothetical protein
MGRASGPGKTTPSGSGGDGAGFVVSASCATMATVAALAISSAADAACA